MSAKCANSQLSIFTRVSICKKIIFVVAKLYYVFQTNPCARLNVQNFNRIFALLNWRDALEPIRRDNLLRPVWEAWFPPSAPVPDCVCARLPPRSRTPVSPYRLPHETISCFVRFHGLLVRERAWGSFWTFERTCKFISFSGCRHGFQQIISSLFVGNFCCEISAIFFFLNSCTVHPFQGFLRQDSLCREKKMFIAPCFKTSFFKLHSATLPVNARMEERGIFVS